MAEVGTSKVRKKHIRMGLKQSTWIDLDIVKDGEFSIGLETSGIKINYFRMAGYRFWIGPEGGWRIWIEIKFGTIHHLQRQSE